jgi:radical SAM superfamily enzyme YgiQ (UPF0313 family)
MITLLLNPPWSVPGYHGVRAGSRWPHLEESATTAYMPFPFFMGYAAAVLERENFPVFVIDACAERLTVEQCLNRVAGHKPDLVVVETSTPTIDMDLAFCSQIKRLRSETKIALCGAHALMGRPEFLAEQPDIDYVFRGEYEFVLLGLVKCLSTESSPGGVAGLIFKDSHGTAIDNGPRPLLDDLDSLPWPARHLFPMNAYWDNPGGIPAPSLQMWASRGCPFQCIFCVWPQVMYGGNRYRVRNPVDVVDELEFCLKTWRFKSFYFDDDTFNIGKRRIMRLADEIRRRGIALPWAVMARADLVDYELLKALKDAGLVAIKYGMESGVQEIIDGCGKKLKVEQVEEALRLSKKLGIEVHLTFTFGLPGETKDTIKRTIRKAIELDPCTVQFSIATPFPGTVYHNALEARGHIVSHNLADYSGSTGAVHRTETLGKDDLDRALEEAHDAWRLHKKISSSSFSALLKEGLRHPIQAGAAVYRVGRYLINLRA